MLKGKLKRIFIPASVALGLLTICLLPSESHETQAYPDNLWTSGGQFSNPSQTEKLLRWNRIEYGVPWAWLVHDSCTTESAWYVRIATPYLVLYAAVAFFGGFVSLAFIEFQNRNVH